MRGEGRGPEPDAFEEELVVRLDARAGQLSGGRPPLAELRSAGRRRARRGLLRRVAAGAVVLLVGVGALTQLESFAGAGRPVPAWGGESGPEDDDPGGLSGVCRGGPASLREYTWEQIHGLAPTPPLPSGDDGSWDTPAPEMTAKLEQIIRRSLVVANAVRRFGERMYPDSWFGACSDWTTNTVYVMRAPGSDLDIALAKAVPHSGVTLKFVDVARSRKSYEAVAERIKSTDAGYWAQRNVTITDVWISPDGAGLIVITQQVEAARAQILARYGAGLVIEVRPRY
ncbi:hypothetical protein ACFXAF_30600 [Kitasatospora sp. NPDC059463]|uniref:hypothetical protein n=1 Tax=unclassified Kitasatospora TaxID=2633591 RepID=UPI0036B1C0AE